MKKKKEIKIGPHYLPRKKKKAALKMLNNITNTTYVWPVDEEDRGDDGKLRKNKLK